MHSFKDLVRNLHTLRQTLKYLTQILHSQKTKAKPAFLNTHTQIPICNSKPTFNETNTEIPTQNLKPS